MPALRNALRKPKPVIGFIIMCLSFAWDMNYWSFHRIDLFTMVDQRDMVKRKYFPKFSDLRDIACYCVVNSQENIYIQF